MAGLRKSGGVGDATRTMEEGGAEDAHHPAEPGGPWEFRVRRHGRGPARLAVERRGAGVDLRRRWDGRRPAHQRGSRCRALTATTGIGPVGPTRAHPSANRSVKETLRRRGGGWGRVPSRSRALADHRPRRCAVRLNRSRPEGGQDSGDEVSPGRRRAASGGATGHRRITSSRRGTAIAAPRIGGCDGTLGRTGDVRSVGHAARARQDGFGSGRPVRRTRRGARRSGGVGACGVGVPGGCDRHGVHAAGAQAASPTETLRRLPKWRRARSMVAALVAWSGFSMRRTSLSATPRSRARRRFEMSASRNAS